MTADAHGILALGNYVPRARLPRTLVADAHRWFAPSLKAGPDERRAFCNWDEDSLTLAVEAGRRALVDNDDVKALELASTTLPFADRSNAGVVREALDIDASARVADTSGSLRAGSSALLRSLTDALPEQRLIVAADSVDAKPASSQEMSFGHGASALVVGRGEPIATLVGAASLHQDFVDHYRAATERFEYALEPRWVRDAGYRQQVTKTVSAALHNGGVAPGDLSRVAVSAPGGVGRAVSRALRKELGLPDASQALESQLGFCGAAQPFLALSEALEASKPDDVVLLVSLGQGVDVILLRVLHTPATASLADAIAAGIDEDNYTRYLALRGLLPLETGIRAERDNRTSQSAFWRKHDAITAFKGGQCSACGTLQFPMSKVCVNCGAADAQSPARLADLPGRVRSFTEDWLAYTPRPPLIFGNVGFSDGANVMMEFTDVSPGQLEVGTAVRMEFRIKDIDDRRHFRRYFWKPVPVSESTHA